jgi:LemA protein
MATARLIFAAPTFIHRAGRPVGMEIYLIVGIVLAVLVVLWYVTTYNRLIRMKNECDRAWSNIDVLLQQRYDELPGIVNAVKGYAKHEKGIFEEFAKARQMASSARSAGDVSGVGRAEGMLAGIMPQIYAVAEQYPELKADGNFLNLQHAVSEIEDDLADRREFYNSASTNWNTAIEVIPANIVASTMGAVRRDLWEVSNVKARDSMFESVDVVF